LDGKICQLPLRDGPLRGLDGHGKICFIERRSNVPAGFKDGAIMSANSLYNNLDPPASPDASPVDILQRYTDILQKEPNASSLNMQVLNCVRSGKSRDLKKFFSRPEFRDRSHLAVANDIDFAHLAFQLTLQRTAWTAVESGINELAAITVYLDYRKKAAEAGSVEEVQNLLQASQIDYADMVDALKKEKLPPLAQRCREYIAAHIYEPVNVNRIAKKLRVSRSYLSRTYKEACGETIIERIHKEKIAAAEMLLVHSQSPVVNIAMDLGFSSQSHFSQVFRKEKGMTPSQYRALKKV
jgi:AraC-like DNA-binding protein